MVVTQGYENSSHSKPKTFYWHIQFGQPFSSYEAFDLDQRHFSGRCPWLPGGSKARRRQWNEVLRHTRQKMFSWHVLFEQLFLNGGIYYFDRSHICWRCGCGDLARNVRPLENGCSKRMSQWNIFRLEYSILSFYRRRCALLPPGSLWHHPGQN